VTTPLKPDLGSIDLTEALEWGREHSVAESPSQCRATVFDYADIAMEFHNGAVGSLVLSHASFLRKGLAPELELHGTRASLAVDRVTGNITLARPGEDVRVLETVAESARNRFSSVVFPAIHERASGSGCEHPGLDDGWQVQVFTDAAFQSAQRGEWVDLAEVEEESTGTRT
jgi:predicted dehydrogenase